MASTIVPIGHGKNRAGHLARRRQWFAERDLGEAVEATARLLRCAHEALPEGKRNQQTAMLLGMALEELDLALEANAAKAARDLREHLLTALGPGLTWGGVDGARRALGLLLTVLEDERERDRNGP